MSLRHEHLRGKGWRQHSGSSADCRSGQCGSRSNRLRHGHAARNGLIARTAHDDCEGLFDKAFLRGEYGVKCVLILCGHDIFAQILLLFNPRFTRGKVLRFIYTGKNNLTMESVVYIQMTAHFYDLKTLEENCLAFFDENVQRSNVTEAFSDAHNLNSIVLKDKCIAIMKKRIPCMLQIYSMELSAIHEFFKKITFLDYKVVFQWLLIWAKKQPGYNDDNGNSLRKLVASRLDVVRFTKMKMPQFNECLEMAGPDFFWPAEIGSIVLQILHPFYTFKKYEEALALALCND